MTDSFLENAGGYTPVPDKLVREYDYTTAYVWGKIWRYCQMANGACTASHETIANRAGMSRRTLIEKLNVLIKDGYIEDLTPELKNKPHTYCTKKGEAKITSTMQISHTESDNPTEDNKVSTSESDLDMRILHSDDAEFTQPDNPTVQNLHSSYAENAQPTMQNLHLKKESKKTPLRNKESKELSPKQKLFLTLADLCHIELRAASEKQRGQLDNASKALVKLITDTDQFKAKFPEYWTTMDWRGKKGQSPDPPQIQEAYGDYCYWLKNGALALRKASQNGIYSKPNQRHNQGQPTGQELKSRETIDYRTGERVLADGTRIPIVNDTS